jgi:glutathione S-transferase
MQRPLLYTYRRCPYAIRARMALLQAGIAFDAHEIVLRDKPPELLALSPKATVPVLVLPDGRVIEQSMDIIRWAFEGPDHAGWWGRADMPDNQALIERNDGPFKQHLDRYKYPQRHAPVDPTVGRDQAAACLLHLLEQRLASAAWLGGDAPCAADLAIFPFVRQFRAVDAGWFDAQPWPATRRWLQGWVEGEQFEACMRKLPSGISVGFGAL